MKTSRNTDEIILRELSIYKWGDRWYCTKCGHNVYISGKKPYSRRCKKCKYDESVLKFTAFEGLRFPISIAHKFLHKMVSTAIVNQEKKLLQRGKFQPELNKPEKLISIVDYIVYCQQKNMHPWDIDERIARIIKRQRPSLRGLAERYGIEENTATKFINKINARIGLNEMPEYDNAHERFITFVNEHYDKEMDFYLSMLSVPLVGKWKLGECRIHNKQYALTIDRWSHWAVHEVSFKADERGDYTYPFELKERIEYGCEKWRSIFCSNPV